MAENNNLGELDVVIGADWSDLQDAIGEAVSAAQAGAGAIAEAFSDASTFAAMATAIDLATESIYEMGDAAASVASSVADVGESMSALGDSAADAQGSIANVGTASTQTGEAATEAASGVNDFAVAASGAGDEAAGATSGIQEFAEAEGAAGSAGEEASSGISVFRGSLLELAEGLAVTEGLKELAEDALEAYASIQQATVSLTALTGSAESADQMIEQLEATALQIPVATEGLVSAAQRMTAFGLTADQVTTLLGDAANAAYATGGAFDSVATRIGNMAAAGQAGARQLLTLGLSGQQLADTMNALGVTTDATAATITKAFKGLDVDTRVEVLDAALQKFSGIAQDSAQTVGGAWQILQNQWEEVFKDLGAELAPLASDVIAFGSSVATGIESAIKVFDSLPPVIQQVGVAAAVVLGASGPLLTGLAALSLTVTGLKSVPEVFAGLASSLGYAGTAAGAAAPEVATLAGAEEASSAAAAQSVGPHTAAAAAMTGEGGAAAAAAIQLGLFDDAAVGTQLALFDVNSSLGAMAIGTQAATAEVGVFEGGLVGLVEIIPTIAIALSALQLGEWVTSNGDFKQFFIDAKGDIEDFASQLGPVGTAVTNFLNSFGGVDPAKVFIATVDNAIQAVENLPGPIGTLATSLQHLHDAWESSLAPTEETQLQISGLQGLLKGVGVEIDQGSMSLGQYAATLETAARGLGLVGTAADGATTSTKATTGAFSDGSIAAQKIYAEVQKLTNNLDLANAALEVAKEDLDAAQTSGVGVATALNDVAAAQANVTKATNSLNSALGEHKTKVDAASASWQVLSQDQAAALVEEAELANSFGGQVAAAMEKATDAQATAANEANVLAGVWLTLATSGTASADAQAAAWAKASQAATKAGIDIGTAVNSAATQMGGISKEVGAAVTALETLATSGTASAGQLHDALVNVNTVAGSTGVSLQAVADKINAISAATGGMAAVIQNGQIELVALGTAGQAAATGVQKADDSALAFMTTSTYLGFLVPTIAAGVASLGPAGQTAATGIGAADTALQGLSTTAGTIKTTVVNTTDAITGASAAITIYTSKVNDATTAATAHVAANKTDAASYQGVGQAAGSAAPYISAYSQSVMQGGTYAESAANSFDNAGLSLTKFGTVTGDAYHYATQLGGSMTDLNTISDSFIGTANTAATSVQTFGVNATNANGTTETLGVTIQGVTNDAGDFADGMTTAASDGATATGELVTYWDNVAQAVDTAAQAVQNFGDIDASVSGGKSGSGGGGQSFLDAYLGSNPTEISSSLIGMQSIANALGFIYSNPVGYGGTVPGPIGGGPMFGDIEGAPGSEESTPPAVIQTVEALKSLKGAADIATASLSVTGGLTGSLGNFGDTVSATQEALNILNDEANENAIPGLGDLATSVTTLGAAAGATATQLQAAQSGFSAAAPSGTDVGGTMLDTTTGQQVQSQIDTALGDWFFSNVANGGQGGYELDATTAESPVVVANGQNTTTTYSPASSAPLPNGMQVAEPSGTQVSPTQVDTPQGDWYQGMYNGRLVWQLQAAMSAVTEMGPNSGVSTPGTAATNGFSATAPQGTAVGGTMLDTATGQQVQSQIDTALGDYYFSNLNGPAGGWQLQAGMAEIGSFGNGGNATFGSGSNGSSSVAPNITLNISGVTPSAANQLMNTAITQLRLGARLNL